MKRLTVFALCAGSAAVLIGATPPKDGELAVTVTGLRNAKGMIRACLSANPELFTKCDKDPKALKVSVSAEGPAKGQVELMFGPLKPGKYAIAVLHDENANGKMDKALGMMPKEGFGFSRDAPVRMGPPKFEDAVFDYTGKAKVQTIKMRYML